MKIFLDYFLFWRKIRIEDGVRQASFVSRETAGVGASSFSEFFHVKTNSSPAIQ